MTIQKTPVPNSAGTEAPLHKMPPHACDSHMHIFDPARPRAEGSTGHGATQASTADYRLMQARLGLERAVVVTPRYYLTDNSVTLDAIRELGSDRTRGVGVVDGSISSSDLRALRDGGILGIRYTTPHVTADHPVFEETAALAPRLADMGMHLQLHWTVDQILAHGPLFLSFPCPVVIDHMGRLPKSTGMKHPAYELIRRRLDGGHTWIKLSGWYLDSAVGAPWADTVAIGAEFAKAAPERMVWGTDWPHVSPGPKPDGALLADVLAACVPDQQARHRILVDNPAELYEFANSAG